MIEFVFHYNVYCFLAKISILCLNDIFYQKKGVSLENLFTFPEITKETTSAEFTRLFYVACSRAKNELYIHIEDNSLSTIIEKKLNQFKKDKGVKIHYEFIL